MPIDVNAKLRERMRRYLGRVPAQEIRDDEPAAMVLAPVEAGLSRFIQVDNLPDLDNLPFIPERMRDFAFRYATEYKPIKVFAKEYGVHFHTIEKWLRHEGVRAYIAICRFEQRMFNLAQHVILQRNVYKTINAILATKITADTIEAIGKMARFCYQVLSDPESAHDRAKGVLNVNIGFPRDGDVSGNGRNPYKQERNVTPRELEALEADIEEIEILARLVNKDNGEEQDE